MGLAAQRRGVVAAGSRDTAQAARDLLDAGGNAVDAAVGAAFATFVCEPMLTDIGGGGFMLVDRGDRAEVLDFFVSVPGLGRRTPRHLADLDFGPLELDFGDAKQIFHVGLGAAAVPGNVHGLCTAHARHGRLPLREVVAPAVRYGREGVVLTEEMAAILTLIAPVFRRSRRLAEDVLGGDRRSPRPGDRLRMARTADLIEAIGQEGLALFYRGEIAERIARQCRQRGGLITRTDLSAYETAVRPPLTVEVFGARVALNPPPSTGGALIALGLELAHEMGWAFAPESPDGAVALAALFETTAKARAEVLDQVLLQGGYQEHLLGQPHHLLDYAQRLRTRLARSRDEDPPAAALPSRGATTHLSVVDDQGWAVAVTTSNGEGSGCEVGDTGVHLNNMLGEEDLNPGGFHLYPAGDRLPSMMCPTSVRRPDGLTLALGSGGANRLRTAIAQTLLRVLAGGAPLEAAVKAPRLHYERGTVDVEPGLPEATEEALERAGFPLRRFRAQNLYFGGVHAAAVMPGGAFVGAGDPRRGGAVA